MAGELSRLLCRGLGGLGKIVIDHLADERFGIGLVASFQGGLLCFEGRLHQLVRLLNVDVGHRPVVLAVAVDALELQSLLRLEVVTTRVGGDRGVR